MVHKLLVPSLTPTERTRAHFFLLRRSTMVLQIMLHFCLTFAKDHAASPPPPGGPTWTLLREWRLNDLTHTYVTLRCCTWHDFLVCTTVRVLLIFLQRSRSGRCWRHKITTHVRTKMISYLTSPNLSLQWKMGDPGDGPEGLTGLSVVAFNWLEPASIVLAVGTEVNYRSAVFGISMT